MRWTGKLEQRTRAGRQAEEAEEAEEAGEESEDGMTENNQRHVHGHSKETQHVHGLEKWKP